ncbi:hypothetical protein [Algoriphagus vanfongensis]|uniref:hypothetical protein n=1 Tax=Algoriphagus vanfongensis TaxID=426371 RepID=UPI0003F5E820|nr:hypothetical protein [Algoriphagus vanfongensis]
MFKNLVLRLFIAWIGLSVSASAFASTKSLSCDVENQTISQSFASNHGSIAGLGDASLDFVQSYVKTYYTPQQEIFWEVEEDKQRDFISLKRVPLDWAILFEDWISVLFDGLSSKSKNYFDFPAASFHAVPIHIFKQVFVI